MTPIIEEISRELIEAELTPKYLLRKTNNANNCIYTFRAHECPNTMREVGRLRELTFREAGGGTDLEVDIDEGDIAEDGYLQMIVWDPNAREVVGGYRYIISTTEYPNHLSSEKYFKLSDKFRKEYLPSTIELGRSFVQPNYQGSKVNPKGLYALDNLWDGLCALIVYTDGAKYFFGKITMYDSYNKEARNLITAFMNKYFGDDKELVTPRYPIKIEADLDEIGKMFCHDNYKDDYKVLNKAVRALGENIPPLFNSYMNISATMKVFGAVTNPDFGAVEETAILITFDDVYPQKISRHTQGL